VRGCRGAILSSWEEEGGTVVLMGVLIMRLMNVEDPGEALSDIQHCLVYGFSMYEWKSITSLRGNHHSVNILTMLYEICCYRRFGSREQTSPAYTSCQKSLAATAPPRKAAEASSSARSNEIFRVAMLRGRLVDCGIIFQWDRCCRTPDKQRAGMRSSWFADEAEDLGCQAWRHAY